MNNHLESLFKKSIDTINDNIDKSYTVDDDMKLKLYKYYKQATIGDCNIPQPSLFDFTNKIKWEAWNSIKGISTDKAKCSYIKLVQSIIDSSTNNSSHNSFTDNSSTHNN